MGRTGSSKQPPRQGAGRPDPRFARFTRAEERWLAAHGSPERAQQVLDALPYRCEYDQLPAACALREWRAHCFDGSLLAAAMLRRGGYDPRLIDLCARDDDDHLLCAFRWRGRWGAIAKSNFPGLRFREPIFRTPRELVLSYFEVYFDLRGRKSLRSFSSPVRLPATNRVDWECGAEAPAELLQRLALAPHQNILLPRQETRLSRMSPRLFESQMSGVVLEGAHGGSSFRPLSKLKALRRPSADVRRAKS